MEAEGELKARLMVEMEAEIEKLLAEAGDRGAVTLAEIERVVGEVGHRIQRRLAEQWVKAAAQEQGQVRGKCPECGGKLRYKGQKARWVATTSGEVKVERGYCYCEACGKGNFPPGSEMGIE